VEYAVIGAGVSGAWTALHLARLGKSVVLIDASHPGAGATGRNAGLLLAESECFGAAAREHGDEAARELRMAGLATRLLVRDLVGPAKASVGLRWCGSVRLASDASESRAFADSESAGLDWVARGDLDRVSERGASRAYIDALVDRGDAVVHPLKLLALVLDEARSHGAVLHQNTSVLELRPASHHVDLVTTRGSLRAERVVMATNAASRRLLPAARPVRPVRAQALAARVHPAPRWRRAVYATNGGDYWRTLPGGRVLLGGLRRMRRREENTRDSAPTEVLQIALRAFLRDLVGPEALIHITHAWAGTMAFTPDGLPWVGRIPGASRVAIIAGMNGHGMGWAPALAKDLVDHLAGDAPPPHFNPAR
jgi:gamma-glutamylputrescine oxidase